MFIAHFPMGYIIGSLAKNRQIKNGQDMPPYFLAVSLLGSIFPDFDLVYFYLIDHRQHHHHAYVTHYPIVWIVPLIASLVYFLTKKNPKSLLFLVFFINIFLHLILDSIVGDVWWLMPFVNKPFAMATVPNLYSPWWLNFLLHWLFWLEILIVSVAVFLFFKNKNCMINRKVT